MTGYGFWLLPSKEVLSNYNKIIEQLSQKYGTDNFEAHITVLSRLEGNEKELVKYVEKISAQFAAIPIEFMGINIGNTIHTSVFAQVKMSALLLRLHNALKSGLGYTEDYRFFPHMSLVYGDFSPEEKVKIASEINLEDNSFLADKVVVVRADSGKPEDWVHIAEFNLKQS